jgi:single-stranded DNA-specific DHH superfamily exonuclease
MIESAVDFIIKNGNKKTLIIYDTDGDGIGAAAILARMFKKLFRKNPKIIPAGHGEEFINKKIFEQMKNEKFDNIITVDIALDEDPKYILKISKKSKVLIIDHHQTRRDLNKVKNITHVNPDLWKSNIPSYKYCTSKMVYDICNKITNIENLDWLAGIGIMNDKCEDNWKAFVNKIYKKYPVLKNKLKILNNIITSGYFYSKKEGSKLGLKACLEASTPTDILKGKTPASKKLKKFYNDVEKEIEEIMKTWKEKAEIIESKKIIFLELNTRFYINSPISNKISFMKPDYTLFVLKRKGKMTNISLRRQDGKVNCGKLAYNATKNLENANGGGHVPAAGARVMTKDWNKFKETVVNLL